VSFGKQNCFQAIEDKNFETFAEITMKDSNQFHSVCLDTFPPAVYMNDVSHAIVDFVHVYNKVKGKTKVRTPRILLLNLKSAIGRLGCD
jgi:diphosphomevalonate decarboxylase